MRLAKLSKFRELVYADGSAPSLNTLRSRIDKAEIPGGTIDAGLYYVDLDEYDRAHGLRSSIELKRAALANDESLQGLI